MTGHRWSKFWWQDWQADQALRSCSLAARGLWMDMLCIAHNGTPRGHVTINGRAVTPRRLATLAGTSEKECIALLDELEEAGVFSRDTDGIIYSRRMVRDTEHADAGRDAVGKRWLKPQHPTAPPTGTPIRGGNRGGNSPPTETPITQEAEIEDKKERKDINPSFSEPSACARAETAPEPSWPPPPTPSAVTATVDALAARLEGRHRDTRIPGPAPPTRSAADQIAILTPKPIRAHHAPTSVLADARAKLAGRTAP